MSDIKNKAVLIREQEERFARTLSTQVIESPGLSLWMILIPIIFVYYFYQFQKCTAGRKTFTENYLISRNRALQEAVRAIETKEEADSEKIVRQANTIPQTAQKAYREWIQLLAEHYTDLLRSDGEDFDALVRSAYQSRANLLLFLNRLNHAEKQLNAALRMYISDNSEETEITIRTMERHSERLRREWVEKIWGAR